MTTVIEPSVLDGAIPMVRHATRATDIERGDVVTNLGIVDAVRRDGVFVVAAIRGTVWSTASGKGNVHTLDVVWHESQYVTLDKV